MVRRFTLCILVFAAIMVVGGNIVQAQSPVSSGASFSDDPPQETCSHMSIRRATKVFRHLDGTRSRAKNWFLSPHGTAGIRYAGPKVTGLIPRGFSVQSIWSEHITRWSEYDTGLQGYKIKFSEGEVWCIPDPGTDQVETPIASCPTTLDQAWNMFGGSRKRWTGHLYDPDQWTFYYNEWNHPRVPKVAFYVPFQAEVWDWVSRDGSSVVYGPGYRLRKSRNFTLICYNTHGQLPAGS